MVCIQPASGYARHMTQITSGDAALPIPAHAGHFIAEMLGTGPIRAVGPGRFAAGADRLRLHPATSDWEAMAAWLSERSSMSEKTYQASLREMRRLSYYLLGRPYAKPQERAPTPPCFSDMSPEDWQAYRRWLETAPRSEHMTRGYRFGSEQWRPFRAKGRAKHSAPLDPRRDAETIAEPGLSARSAGLVMQTLCQMLDWQVQCGYLQTNTLRATPSTLRMPRGRKRSSRAFRLSDRQLNALHASIEGMPEITERQRIRKARARFVIRLSQDMGLRRSDFALNKMSAFRWEDVPVPGGACKRVMVWQGRRKYYEEADPLIVPASAVRELARYRQAIGLPASLDPSIDEHEPMVVSLRFYKTARAVRKVQSSVERGLSSESLGNEIKAIYEAAAIHLLETQGPPGACLTQLDRLEDPGLREAVEGLRTASSHFMRYRFVTDLISADEHPEVIRLMTGHKTTAVLSTYNKSDLSSMLAAHMRLRGSTTTE